MHTRVGWVVKELVAGALLSLCALLSFLLHL